MEYFMDIVLICFLVISLIFGGATFGVLYAWYRKAKEGKCGAVFNYDPHITTTTQLPYSTEAANCKHSWDVLDKGILKMPHEEKYVMVMKCTFCGVIDKTIEVTSEVPPPPPPEPCKHDWDTVQNTKLGTDTEQKTVVILKCLKCGLIDKTTETVKQPAPPPPPVPRSECRHKWNIEKGVHLESAYEQMVKGMRSKKRSSSYYSSSKKDKDEEKKLNLDLDDAPQWMFRKTYVGARVCTQCGEIDKIIASNFDMPGQEEEE